MAITMSDLLMYWTDWTFLAAFAIVLLLLVALLLLRVTSVNRHDSPLGARAGRSPSQDGEGMEAPDASPGAWEDIATEDAATEPPQPLSSFATTSPLADRQEAASLHTSISEAEELENADPTEAARKWGALGRWSHAANLYEQGGQPMEAARVYVAMHEHGHAVPLLQEAFKKNPTDEGLRLLLVETLFNAGDQREAGRLVDAICEEDSAVKPSGHFLDSVARIYETLGDNSRALHFYQLAQATGETIPELEQRVVFLKHLHRLSTPYEQDAEDSPAREFLSRELMKDSTIRPIPKELLETETYEEELGSEEYEGPMTARELLGHEIIVGHLAFGFCREEPYNPVGSVFSLSRRFAIHSILKENEVSVTFEAVDRVLDYPVALRIQRLRPEMPNIGMLRHRLREIAQLNHPNLAKLTFVDREGPMLRVATEFLPGGNLKEYMARIGGAGIPLLVRMCMYLSSALYTAHLRGIPHGDIRPENVLIAKDHKLKLIDFALSPMPVQRLDEEINQLSDSSEAPKVMELMAKNEGIQSDLVQMGDIVEFMLGHVREDSVVPSTDGTNPREELEELAWQLHHERFSSVLPLWQVLEEIFQRTVPAKAAPDADPQART